MLFKEKQSEQRPSFQEALASALTAALEDGLIIYDADFKVLQLNKAAEDILEIKAAEVEGKNFSLDKARSFKSPLLAAVIFPSLAPIILRRSRPGRYPQVLDISLNKPRRDLRIITNKIIGGGGQVAGFVKVVEDRTRERELAKTKSDFITVAAHQLRTPATGINWALSNLLADKNISGDSRRTLLMARQAAQNLLDIINDLISLSQLEEGKFSYKFRIINLTNFLKKIAAQADLTAQEAGVKLYFQPPANADLSVKADSEKLGAAFANLIDNGIKYNVKNGEVVIAVRRQGNKAVVSIKDTGVGMSDKDVKRLFGRFARGESAKRAGVGGSGLGLYLAKKIVEAHGGNISVKSVPSRGSTFIVSLPINVSKT